MNSLKAQGKRLAKAEQQLHILRDYEAVGIAEFAKKINELGLLPLKSTGIEIFQVNVGKMCNQTCAHCHVDAGPDRKEIMTRDTMALCLQALEDSSISTVDLTGGAPEMNPDFRWFVTELSKKEKKIIVRCNLTIIVANPKHHDLPEFFKEHNVEVISSLPYFAAKRTDAQRGDGVFEKSIKALKLLNEVGYGMEGSGLTLNLVHNPSGAFLPEDQMGLETQFKRKLLKGYGINFNSLYAITNLPISRFLEYLIMTDKYESYMEELANAFNPRAVESVMCRNTLSVSWDGYLYDCDFNQMLELKVNGRTPKHLKDFDLQKLNERNIVVNQHCYGCTAGAGSSCGGEIT